MKKVNALKLLIILAANLGLASTAGAAAIQYNDVLTKDQMLANSMGGEIRKKKSDLLVRVLCLEYSMQSTELECLQYGLVELQNLRNETYRVTSVIRYESLDPQGEAERSLKEKKFAKRSKRKNGIINVIPGTMIGFVAAGLSAEANTTATGIVIGLVLIPIGMTFDVVSAPIRLPAMMVKSVRYRKTVKRFLKSISSNDQSYVGTLNEDDFNFATDTKNLVEMPK